MKVGFELIKIFKPLCCTGERAARHHNATKLARQKPRFTGGPSVHVFYWQVFSSRKQIVESFLSDY